MPLKGNEIDLEDNKAAYEKKIHRQLKQQKSEIKNLVKIAKDRHAEQNTEVNRLLEEVQAKLEEAWQKYEELKDEENALWPEGSRDVSTAYKELEDLVDEVSAKVKQK